MVVLIGGWLCADDFVVNMVNSVVVILFVLMNLS